MTVIDIRPATPEEAAVGYSPIIIFTTHHLPIMNSKKVEYIKSIVPVGRKIYHMESDFFVESITNPVFQAVLRKVIEQGQLHNVAKDLEITLIDDAEVYDSLIVHNTTTGRWMMLSVNPKADDQPTPTYHLAACYPASVRKFYLDVEYAVHVAPEISQESIDADFLEEAADFCYGYADPEDATITKLPATDNLELVTDIIKGKIAFVDTPENVFHYSNLVFVGLITGVVSLEGSLLVLTQHDNGDVEKYGIYKHHVKTTGIPLSVAANLHLIRPGNYLVQLPPDHATNGEDDYSCYRAWTREQVLATFDISETDPRWIEPAINITKEKS